ncbi:MAG: response regulator [Pirellulales bacterium]
MLVLSRGANEEIHFPKLGISVKVVRIDGKRVRLGIDAPRDIEVLRGELTPHSAPTESRANKNSDHQLRNRLNTARLSLELAAKQIEHGMHEPALETLSRSLREFDSIEHDLQHGGAPQSSSPQPAQDAHPRALLVEDNPNERELLAGYLSLSGFDVDTAGDGLGALVQLSRCEPPSVVLLDMNMPKLDGRSTLDRIRGQEALRKTRVIAVSGLRPEDVGIEIGPEGVDCWFQKPVDPKAIVAEIERELSITT